MARRKNGILPIGSMEGPRQWKKRTWIPEIGEQYAADYERLKAKLNVLQTARDQGAGGLPKKIDKTLNEIQLRIIEEIFRGIALLNQFLADQVGAAIDEMLSLRVPHLDEETEKAAIDRAVSRSLTEHRKELQSLVEKEVEAHVELRYFKANNGLHRSAKYSASVMLPIALMVGLATIESVLNAALFQQVSTRGAIGGFAIAIAISAVNVTLGWFGGLVGWRLLGHKKLAFKGLGFVCALGALVGGVAVNVCAGHYRDVIAEAAALGLRGSALASATGNVLGHIRQYGLFGFASPLSAMLFALGLANHIIVSFKSWDGIADRYWDYARYDRSYEQARREFAEAIASVEQNVHDAVDEVLDRAAAKTRRAQEVGAEIEGCLELALQREREVRDSERDWVRKGEALLRAYREENERVRAPGTAPSYFSSFPSIEDYRRGLLGLTEEHAAYQSATVRLSERLDRLRDVLASARLDIEENARIEKRLRVHADGALVELTNKMQDLEIELKASADRAVERKGISGGASASPVAAGA